jgi:hypothetical protein
MLLILLWVFRMVKEDGSFSNFSYRNDITSISHLLPKSLYHRLLWREMKQNRQYISNAYLNGNLCQDIFRSSGELRVERIEARKGRKRNHNNFRSIMSEYNLDFCPYSSDFWVLFNAGTCIECNERSTVS